MRRPLPCRPGCGPRRGARAPAPRPTTSRSCRITSASCSARSALSVSSPASPGPAPTSTTEPRFGDLPRDVSAETSGVVDSCARARAPPPPARPARTCAATSPADRRLVEAPPRCEIGKRRADPAAPAREQRRERAERLVDQRLEPLADQPREHGRRAAGRHRDHDRRAVDDRGHDEARQLRVIDDVDEDVALGGRGGDVRIEPRDRLVAAIDEHDTVELRVVELRGAMRDLAAGPSAARSASQGVSSRATRSTRAPASSSSRTLRSATSPPPTTSTRRPCRSANNGK